MKQLRVSGRTVPIPFAPSVLYRLIPGAWYGVGNFIQTLFIPADVLAATWTGTNTLSLLVTFTTVALVLPLLLLFRLRAARVLLTVFGVWFTAGMAWQLTVEALAAFMPVMAGTILMWPPPSNRYMARRHVIGNGAQL